MKPILTVMVGISGSGKSRFSDGLKTSLNAEVVETDAIRAELFGSAADQSNPGLVFKTAGKRVSDYLAQGKNVVIDATSITVRDRKMWVEIAKANNAECNAVFVNTPVAVAKERNLKRPRQVPDFVIDRQANKLVPPSRTEGFDSVKVVS